MDEAEVKRAWEKLVESLSLFTQPGLSLYTHLYETTQVSTLLLHLSVDYTHLYETTQFAIRFVPLLSIELVLVERSTFQQRVRVRPSRSHDALARYLGGRSSIDESIASKERCKIPHQRA